MKYTDIKNAKYTSNGDINCWVKFKKFREYVPFTASYNDIEEHSKLIYNDIVSGKFGSIKDAT